MAEVDWDERARQGVGLQSVIDPGDRNGLKNGLIDRIQWGVVQPWARSRREVLDYGCGIGRFAKRITAAGTAYCGVDSSAAMIEAARQLHPGGPATFAHAADLPLPLASGRFDGCLTVGVLQCLTTADGQALRAAVAELARVLQAGGELLMIEQASASGPRIGRDLVQSLDGGRGRTPAAGQDRAGACYPRPELIDLHAVWWRRPGGEPGKSPRN